jgi:hypothetical protein
MLYGHACVLVYIQSLFLSGKIKVTKKDDEEVHDRRVFAGNFISLSIRIKEI